MLSLFRRNFIFQAVQDLANSIEKEILNSQNSREPQRVTFQNDKKKSPLHFPLYKKGGLYCLCLYCFAPSPQPSPVLDLLHARRVSPPSCRSAGFICSLSGLSSVRKSAVGRGNTLRHRITAAAKIFFQEFLN